MYDEQTMYESIPVLPDDTLAAMDEESIGDYMELLGAKVEFEKTHKMLYFTPDDWFLKACDLMIDEPVSGVICGNRMGKSYSSTWLMAMHLTGAYPEWFQGYRFESHIDTWVLTSTAEQYTQAGGLQEYLFGPLDALGTGWIPKESIEKLEFGIGVKGFIKKAYIKHADGGTSTIEFKSYSQGTLSLMGASISFALVDEEAPYEVLTQVVTRTATPKTGKGTGRTLVSMTPEKGRTQVIDEFFEREGSWQGGLVRATVWDSSLFSREDIEKLQKQYPKHQHDMRLKGIPNLGSGPVFPFTIDELMVYGEQVKIGDNWKCAAAIDFGHGSSRSDPTAILVGVLNPETGVTYVIDEYYEVGRTVPEIAGWLKNKYPNIPVIFPADGKAQRAGAFGTMNSLQDLYKAEGIHMNHEVHYGHVGKKEFGCEQLRILMRQGQFKVMNKCSNWFREQQIYQYSEKNGKPQDGNDHAMDATRYLIQQLNSVGISYYDATSNVPMMYHNRTPRDFSGRKQRY